MGAGPEQAELVCKASSCTVQHVQAISIMERAHVDVASGWYHDRSLVHGCCYWTIPDVFASCDGVLCNDLGLS